MASLRRPRHGAAAVGPLVDRLRRSDRPLHLDVLPVSAPSGPREPDLTVDWSWQGGDRVVLAGRTVLVSLLRPQVVEPSRDDRREHGPHHLLAADQLVVVGRHGPRPGQIEHGTEVTLRLTPSTLPPSARPAATSLDELTALIDQDVEVGMEGGERMVLGGLHRVEDTAELPRPRGRLAAATSVGGHVVLALDDGTVTVVHEPVAVTEGTDGTLHLVGDLGRVVLDLPSAEAHVARDATLEVRPLAPDRPA